MNRMWYSGMEKTPVARRAGCLSVANLQGRKRLHVGGLLVVSHRYVWGRDRTNEQERNITIAHEEDHWKTWYEYEDLIQEVNSFDGQFTLFCPTLKNKYYLKLKSLKHKLEIKTGKFDMEGFNTGGMYDEKK